MDHNKHLYTKLPYYSVFEEYLIPTNEVNGEMSMLKKILINSLVIQDNTTIDAIKNAPNQGVLLKEIKNFLQDYTYNDSKDVGKTIYNIVSEFIENNKELKKHLISSGIRNINIIANKRIFQSLYGLISIAINIHKYITFSKMFDDIYSSSNHICYSSLLKI